MTTPSFSIVVPCYNERDAIRATVEDLSTEFADLGRHELIVVDDGSRDGTGAILDEFVSKGDFPALQVLHHEENQGYGAALKTGIRRATAELIVITDADGTYPKDRIPDLLAAADQADMVVGARTGEEVTYSLIRKIPKALLRAWVSWLAGRNVPDMNSGLRVFRKSVIQHFFRVLPDTFSFTTTITLTMIRNRYRVKFIPINYAARVGTSKISPIPDTLRFIQLILRTGMYFAPIRALMPLVGLLFLGFLASLTYDVFFIRNLTDKTIILLMSGMNTAIFALLADMIEKRSSG